MIKLNELSDLVLNPLSTVVSDEFLKISVDNRFLDKNTIFIVFVGKRFNPLNHLDDVMNSGCKYIVCENKNENLKLIEPYREKLDCLLVENISDFTQKVGHKVATNFKASGGQLVAISGSNGKTTTKEMLFHILSKKLGEDKVFCTQKNNNNHLGVPFTLFQADLDKKVGIVELGSNHPGEIETLCKIVMPQIGITTNIGDTHLEFFESRENVFLEESILNEYCEVFFQNLDDLLLNGLEKKQNWVTFGELSDENSVKITVDSFEYAGLKFQNSNITGKHNQFNLYVSMLIAKKVLGNSDNLREIVESFEPTSNRSEWVNIENSKIFLDAYNANPSSMKVAIEAFADHLGSIGATQNEAILILGDMNELGNKTDSFHRELGEYLNKFSFLKVYFVGRYAKDYACKYQRNFQTSEDTENLKQELRVTEYKYIFIKGSRSLQLETILDIR